MHKGGEGGRRNDTSWVKRSTEGGKRAGFWRLPLGRRAGKGVGGGGGGQWVAWKNNGGGGGGGGGGGE